jgi:hypothetical protein
MKNKFYKAAGLVLAGALFSGQASAISTTTATSEFFIIAFNSAADSNSGSTFIATLDPATFGSVANFTGTSPISVNLASIYADNWNSFLGTGATASNTVYEVIGINQSNSLANARFYTTSASAISPTNSQVSTLYSAVTNPTSSIGTFLYDLSTGAGDITGTDSKVVDGQGAGGFSQFGSNFSGLMPFDSTQTLGVDVNFYGFNRTGFSGTANVASFDTWNLSTDGLLTYSVAAVPESDPVTMMVVGLGIVGLVARRRLKSAV